MLRNWRYTEESHGIGIWTTAYGGQNYDVLLVIEILAHGKRRVII